MKQLEIAVNTTSGLHARPAANLVQTAIGFQSDVYVIKDGRRANAKSMISLLALGVAAGESVAIHADGMDEAEAIAAITQLAARNFGETEHKGA